MSKFTGDDRLIPFVDFSRSHLLYCIYCGAPATTREHVPSKTFLKKPYPSDLPVLPACEKCNNGWSSDELYTSTYIAVMKSLNERKDDAVLQITDKDRKEIIEAKKAVKSFLDTGEFACDIRIKRVLSKLAIGHAVYELAEGYCLPYEERKIASVNYTFRPIISEDNWLMLDRIEPIENMFYPEVGARLLHNLLVFEEIGDKKTTAAPKNKVFIDWSCIQDGNYQYIAIPEGEVIRVKMILLDFLYGEVVISVS